MSTTPTKSATGRPRQVRLDRDETKRKLSSVQGLTILQTIGSLAKARGRPIQKVPQMKEPGQVSGRIVRL